MLERKKKTRQEATARIFVCLSEDIIEKIKNIAGIMAAKKTAEWIPLCHNIELDCVHIECVFKKEGLLIKSQVKSFARTGVKMEAMLATSAAALTVYDMCKMFSKSIEITDLYLLEKRGGKSDVYRRKT